MVAALILGLWLLITAERQRQAFWEAGVFTFIAMVVYYLMNWSVPEVNAVWLLSWFLRWAFVFVVFWLMDVLVTSFIGGALFAIAAGVGYFFLDENVVNLATGWLN